MKAFGQICERNRMRGGGWLCVGGVNSCKSLNPWIFRLWGKGVFPRQVRIDSTTCNLGMVLCTASVKHV